MEIYVFVKAESPLKEYLDIPQTEVFTSLEAAREQLVKARDEYLNHPMDGEYWQVTYETSDYCHMIYNGCSEEVAMSVVKREVCADDNTPETEQAKYEQKAKKWAESSYELRKDAIRIIQAILHENDDELGENDLYAPLSGYLTISDNLTVKEVFFDDQVMVTLTDDFQDMIISITELASWDIIEIANWLVDLKKK